MYCRAGGRGFDSRGRTFTITGRYFICSAKGSIFAWLWSPRTVKQAFPSPAADTNTVTSISTSCWIPSPSQPLGQWEGRKKEKPRAKVETKQLFYWRVLFTIFTWTSFTPDLHNHCFQFLLGITVVPREIEDNGYISQIWGINKVVWRILLSYGACVLSLGKLHDHEPTFDVLKF